MATLVEKIQLTEANTDLPTPEELLAKWHAAAGELPFIQLVQDFPELVDLYFETDRLLNHHKEPPQC